MTEPNLDQMSKDDAIAWFSTTDSLGPAIRSMAPATDPSGPPPEVPMMLASLRLPVHLAEQLDELASRTGVRRSDVMREALTRFVAEQTAPVPRDEAEHALDVLRRVVAKTNGNY